jgi:hypothetical protein
MGDWIMDDAGISFVYSRNLAEGYGLVSQPGRIPVEGYSNPLWVFIFVPFFWMGIFNPLVTPKIVSSIFVLFTLIFLYSGVREILKNRGLAFAVGFLVVINTSFVVWTISGLENSLYVFLAVMMFWVLAFESEWKNTPIVLGILAGLAAITRPDGVVYIIVYPIFLGIRWLGGWKVKDWKNLGVRILRFMFPVLVIVGGYLVFRLIYFGELLPNTYYAKPISLFSSGALKNLITLHPDSFDEIVELWQAVLGQLALVGFILMLISFTHFLTSRKFRPNQWAGLVLFIPAVFIYTVLPKDWMGEYRFATISIPFFYLLLIQLWLGWSDYLRNHTLRNSVLWLFILIFIGVNIPRHIKRTTKFAGDPPTPFTWVVDQYVDKFQKLSDILEQEDASMLVPDMGGTLYYSELTVYDLGALTDSTIARTMRVNQDAFYNYIFDVIHPTFIVTYSGWAQFSNFDADPRFRQDYVPIEESIDASLIVHHIEMYSGTYVRSEFITDPELLDILAAE